MKHMPGCDSVVSAYWDEGGDEQPGKRVREKVKRSRRFSYPMRAGERHRPADLRTSGNSRRCSGRLKVEIRN